MKKAIGFKEKTLGMVNNVLKLCYSKCCTFLKINEKSLAKEKKSPGLKYLLYYLLVIWSDCLTSETMNYLFYKLGLLKLDSRIFIKMKQDYE